MKFTPFGIDPTQVFINGSWVSTASNETLPLVNPSDGSAICDIAKSNTEDVNAAVEAARSAFEGEWGRATAAERGRVLACIGQLVLKHIDELATLEAIDVGKPLNQARADVIALARYMEFYAGAADKLHGQTIPYLDGYTVYTIREPHGVTGHIIPWNYPMQIIGRSIGAALTTGNACVLKPAEEACLTALAFAEITRQAGLPDGALNVVPGLGNEAGAALTAHPDIDHISFTGSVGVGKLIQRTAAENIVPVTLELGGKSPQVVFEDADLDAALPFLVNAGIQNAGQTCSASSRILVQESRYEDVLESMSRRYQALKAGPALDDLDIGPVVSNRQKDIVNGFIGKGQDLQIFAQGGVVSDAPKGGAYVSPTLFAGVSPDHSLAQDEIFGPVQVVIPFKDEEEAVAI
ncbi:MAG: aldehyde dehydrogenase family protein, partial [Pseudomonadota bacterium]